MTARRARRTVHGVDGFVALELAAGVAVLVLPVVMLVASLPGWFDRQSTARQAAREAARALTLVGWCDKARAERVATRVATGANLSAPDIAVVVDCQAGDPLPRDGSVTARVTVAMPGVDVPVIGSVAGWTWTAAHVEPVDPYGSRP